MLEQKYSQIVTNSSTKIKKWQDNENESANLAPPN